MGIDRTSNALVPNQCGEYDVAAAFGRPSLLKLMRRRSDPLLSVRTGLDGPQSLTSHGTRTCVFPSRKQNQFQPHQTKKQKVLAKNCWQGT